MPFEIVKWKPQYAVEDMQVQLCVYSGSHDQNDQPTGVAEKKLENGRDSQQRTEQRERRVAIVGQNLIYQVHDQQWRKDRQKAQRQRRKPTSRSDRLSCSTRPASQFRPKGLSVF